MFQSHDTSSLPVHNTTTSNYHSTSMDVTLLEEVKYFNNLILPFINKDKKIDTPENFDIVSRYILWLFEKRKLKPGFKTEEDLFLSKTFRLHISEIIKAPELWCRWSIQLLADITSQPSSSDTLVQAVSELSFPLKSDLNNILVIALQAQPSLFEINDTNNEFLFCSQHLSLNIIQWILEFSNSGRPPAFWIVESLSLLVPEKFLNAVILFHLSSSIPDQVFAFFTPSQTRALLSNPASLSSFFCNIRNKPYYATFKKTLAFIVHSYIESICSHTTELNCPEFSRFLLPGLVHLLLSGCIPLSELFGILDEKDPSKIFQVIQKETELKFSSYMSKSSGQQPFYPVAHKCWTFILFHVKSSPERLSTFSRATTIISKWIKTIFSNPKNTDKFSLQLQFFSTLLSELNTTIKELSSVGFVSTILQPEPNVDWHKNLEKNSRCIFPESQNGIPTHSQEVYSILDSLFYLLQQDLAWPDHVVTYYCQVCETLFSIVETFIFNTEDKVQIVSFIKYTLSNLVPVRSQNFNLSTSCLIRLVSRFLSACGSKKDLTTILEEIDSKDSKNLSHCLSNFIVLSRNNIVVLYGSSELFKEVLNKINEIEVPSILTVIDVIKYHLQANQEKSIVGSPSICYKIISFGLKTLFLAFRERLETKIPGSVNAYVPLISSLKCLLFQVLKSYDAVVFLQQIFEFITPQPNKNDFNQATREYDDCPRLLEQNCVRAFSDYTKPSFEALPNHTATTTSKSSDLLVLNLFEQRRHIFTDNETAIAIISSNITDFMDLIVQGISELADDKILVTEAMSQVINLKEPALKNLSELNPLISSKLAPSRDQQIFDCFKESPIFLNILSYIATEPELFDKLKCIWGSLLVSLIKFWKIKRASDPSNFFLELSLTRELVRCLGKSRSLPPPLHYVSELFEFSSSSEIGLILHETIWEYLLQRNQVHLTLSVQDCPPASGIESKGLKLIPRAKISPFSCIPTQSTITNNNYFLKNIQQVLKNNVSKTAHLFPLFYQTSEGPANKFYTAKQDK